MSKAIGIAGIGLAIVGCGGLGLMRLVVDTKVVTEVASPTGLMTAQLRSTGLMTTPDLVKTSKRGVFDWVLNDVVIESEVKPALFTFGKEVNAVQRWFNPEQGITMTTELVKPRVLNTVISNVMQQAQSMVLGTWAKPVVTTMGIVEAVAGRILHTIVTGKEDAPREGMLGDEKFAEGVYNGEEMKALGLRLCMFAAAAGVAISPHGPNRSDENEVSDLITSTPAEATSLDSMSRVTGLQTAAVPVAMTIVSVEESFGTSFPENGVVPEPFPKKLRAEEVLGAEVTAESSIISIDDGSAVEKLLTPSTELPSGDSPSPKSLGRDSGVRSSSPSSERDGVEEIFMPSDASPSVPTPMNVEGLSLIHI